MFLACSYKYTCTHKHKYTFFRESTTIEFIKCERNCWELKCSVDCMSIPESRNLTREVIIEQVLFKKISRKETYLEGGNVRRIGKAYHLA